MRRALLVVVALFLCGTALGAVDSVRVIFDGIRAWNLSNMPPCFSAELTSPLVERQLKNIPAGKTEYGAKPRLILAFKQGHELRLIVEHVDEYYRYFFAVYEDILRKSGLLLGISSYTNFGAFIQDYQLFWSPGDAAAPNIVKVVEKEAIPGDYARFHLSPSWQLISSEYYENNVLAATLTVRYRAMGERQIVSALGLEFKDRAVDRSLELKLGTYEPAVPERDF